MSKVWWVQDCVKYPGKEKALAFFADDGVPFLMAMAGVSYPYSKYVMTRQANESVNVFLYVLEGEGEVMIDGKPQRLAPKDLMVLREREVQEYRASPDNPMKTMWINYRANYISAFMDAYKVKSGVYSGEKCVKYFDTAIDATHSSLSRKELCNILVEQVHAIIQHISPIEIDQETVGFSTADKIREMLDSALYKKIDLSRVSMLLHMSKSNVIRIFKKKYRVTPYEYLLTAKMDAAKVMLTSTQMSIKDISDRLCITDEHYFSTLFQKRVGMRPSEYRKNSNG